MIFLANGADIIGYTNKKLTLTLYHITKTNPKCITVLTVKAKITKLLEEKRSKS